MILNSLEYPDDYNESKTRFLNENGFFNFPFLFYLLQKRKLLLLPVYLSTRRYKTFPQRFGSPLRSWIVGVILQRFFIGLQRLSC